MLQAIPETKHSAVERALDTAFGTSVPDSVVRLSGGLSGAGLFRIRVGGIAYVLRIESPPNAFRDHARTYACMGAAAEACLAPPVRYACAADGVAILDYVPEQSLSLDYAGERSDLLVELAQAVRILHETPGFPPLMDYLDAMDLLLGGFSASGVVVPQILDEVLGRYAEAARIYRRLPRQDVSSHNDLNPRNVLYDGRRLWLVDWETAFRADRFVDLAALVNFFAADDAEAEVLLATYFQRAPDAAERARLLLARQISHVFYAVMFLTGAAAGSVASLEGPAMGDLHKALALGEPLFETAEGRSAYGRARLAAALDGLSGSQLVPALAALGA